MKLRDIYLLCCKNIDSISQVESSVTRDSANNQIYSLKDMNKVVDSINELLKVDCLRQYCDKCIKNIPVSYLEADSFNVSSNIWVSLKESINVLKDKVITIVELYESFKIENEEGEIISVKLPSCNSYSDFIKYNDDFKFVLEQSPYLNVKDVTIKFNSVDIGSTWITFLIVASTSTLIIKLLSNLVTLIDYSIIVNSHYINLQQQKELLQRQKKENKEKESITKLIEEMYKIQVRDELNKLNKKIEFDFENGEDEERAKRTTETLGKLIAMGLEIRSELSANDSIQKLFEPLEMKYIKSKNIELIETDEETNI